MRLTIRVLDLTILDLNLELNHDDHDEPVREPPFGFGGGTSLYAERVYPDE